jgi:5-methylcytosine-specific restriction endonuclease McrA
MDSQAGLDAQARDLRVSEHAAPASALGAGGPGQPAPRSGSRVLVLNASYEPINVCTVRRAAVLVLKSRAEILEHHGDPLRSERLRVDRPCVIRLMRYVRIPRDVHRRKISRKAVLARDAYTCQYCGAQASGLTVDHVIPRSRGGQSVWENIVASCAPCNRKKGDRLPREVSMHPRTRPRPPGPNVFIRIASPRIPVAWEPYLVAA